MVAFVFSLIFLLAGLIVAGILFFVNDSEEHTVYIRKVDGREFSRLSYSDNEEDFTVKHIKNKDYYFRKFSAIPLSIGVVLFVVFLLVSVLVSVPTGHTGVVTTFGNVEEQTLDAGMHTKQPWQKVVRMDNRVQKETIELSCFSKDIQEVEIKYTLNYQIDKVNAQNIYRTVGPDYYNVVVQPSVAEAVKVITAKYTAENLVSTRAGLAAEIEELLSSALENYNVKVVSTAIEDMDFTNEFTSAVEAKQVAVQNKLKAQTEQEQKTMEAEQQAERNKIEASAAAEVAKIQAQADMEVAKIGADSAAYQGKKQSVILMRTLAGINGWTAIESEDEEGNTTFIFLDSSNNPVGSDRVEAGADNLIKYMYTQQWDGKLPTYYLNGEDVSTIVVGNNP